MGRRLTALAVSLLALTACDSNPTRPQGRTPYAYVPVEAFPGRTFDAPVGLENAGDNRLFVVEQAGRIMVFDRTTADPATVFLDISGRVASGGERGLLGLAFHPDYASNGYFYVDYTAATPDSNVTRISRFQVSADSSVADPNSEAVLLEFRQPYGNHNGGQLAFGPDGMLYVGVGDGGGAGDTDDNAQNPRNLLGTILRLDVDANAGSPPYHGIPADNPFVGNAMGWREEIWAYGLRNPWRFSFDAATGQLWAGDVGQRTWEEVDIIRKGKNYGWDCREGAHPYVPSGGDDGPSAACDTVTDYVDPIYEYTHANGDESITGGYVYHGPRLTGLTGQYILADYGSGRVRALAYDGTTVTARTLVVTGFPVSSFGLDNAGELYLLQYAQTGAKIYRLAQVHGEAP